MSRYEHSFEGSRIRPSVGRVRAPSRYGVRLSRRRFVTQSHALGGPIAHPLTILLTSLVAAAVFLLGRRLKG